MQQKLLKFLAKLLVTLFLEAAVVSFFTRTNIWDGLWFVAVIHALYGVVFLASRFLPDEKYPEIKSHLTVAPQIYVGWVVHIIYVVSENLDRQEEEAEEQPNPLQLGN